MTIHNKIYKVIMQLSHQQQKAKIFETILTLSCWYSLDSSREVLSDEYQFVWDSVIFQGFLHHFVLPKLASSRIRDNYPIGIGTYTGTIPVYS